MSFAGSDPVECDDIFTDTWERLGERLRSTGYQVIVRTEIPRKITRGGILMTDRGSSFWAGLPNMSDAAKAQDLKPAVTIGIAVSVGNQVEGVKLGDRLLFPRGWFMRYKELDDKSYVGWIREANIWAVLEDDDE